MAAVIARLQASIAAKTAEAASEVAAEAEGVAEAAVAELEAIVEEEVGTQVPARCVPSCADSRPCLPSRQSWDSLSQHSLAKCCCHWQVTLQQRCTFVHVLISS